MKTLLAFLLLSIALMTTYQTKSFAQEDGESMEETTTTATPATTDMDEEEGEDMPEDD